MDFEQYDNYCDYPFAKFGYELAKGGFHQRENDNRKNCWNKKKNLLASFEGPNLPEGGEGSGGLW